MKIKAPFFMPDGEGGGAGQPNEEPKAEGNGTGNEGKSFDDLLKENRDFQSELDRRINKAVETATSKERDRQKIIQDKMQDEVLRVSQMTQDEKDAYFKRKAEDEARAKDESLTRRELVLDAREVLADRKLPDGFVDLLDYSDKDSCLKSIDVLEEAFRTAVQEGVNEKLKGSAPPKDASTEGVKPNSKADDILAQMKQVAGVR